MVPVKLPGLCHHGGTWDLTSHMAHTMSKKTAAVATQEPRKAFDLATRFRRETVVVPILDPVDGHDTGIRIEVKSMQSKEARDVREQYRNTLTIKDGEVTVSEQDAESSLCAQVVAATVTWWAEPDSPDGLLINGEVVPCTPEAVTSLYTDAKTSWVYVPVLTMFLDSDAFFGASKAA